MKCRIVSRLRLLRFGLVLSAMVAALMGAPTGTAWSADSGTSPAFKGIGSNKDPIQIEADNLGVVGPDQIVTITGNVTVRQKDSTLTTQVLKVFYDNTAAPSATSVGTGAQVRRFEASGGLKIVQQDQTVVGDTGWFDMATQKAEVTGSVVLTQANNIARGKKLLINMKSGEYKLEGGERGRIQLLITPNEQAPAKAK